MSSVTVGLSPHSGQLGSRRTFIVRNSIVSASTSSSRFTSGWPTPRICLNTSVAWIEPTIPVIAPSTPASAQEGTSPGGGGSG